MASDTNYMVSVLGDLRRRHVFRVVALYIVGAWLLLQFADVIFPGLGIPETAIRFVIICLIIGFPIALVFGWMYEITPQGIVRTAPLSETDQGPDLSLRGTDYVILGALVLVAVSITYGLIVKLSDVAEIEPASIERMAFPLPDKPSIAVLPFDNMSGDPEQEYFVDGMTEDLITDLSKISGLFVVARNSVFTYKNQPVLVSTVAEQFGVRYVLEGSVRRAGDTVRINAQLIDALTGGHVWAERYDDVTDNVFELQDRVIQKIVSALELNLTLSEKAVGHETTNPEAHDALLRGWAHYRRNSPESFAHAVPYLEQAIEFDPDYSLAYAALATVYAKVMDNTLSTQNNAWVAFQKLSWAEVGERRAENLRHAMENPGALAYQASAFQYSILGHDGEAVAEAERAIDLEPNNPIGYEALAAALIQGGRPAEGAEAIQKAMRLDPRYPYEYLFWLGLAQFNLEQFEQSAETLNRATQGNPEDGRSLIVLAAAFGQLRRTDEAVFAIDALNRLSIERHEIQQGVDFLMFGRATLEGVDLWTFKVAEDRERLREGLRLAGLPETGEDTEVSPLFIPGATSIDVVEAKQLYDRGVMFVDTRPGVDWNTGHVAGAVLLELEEMFTEEALSELVDRDAEVVIYCQGSWCLRSSMGTARAVSWGFEKVYYFRDGFPAWRVAEYPIESD
jgi:TolB-like protein/rhodanese-related sulfurtransferase